MASSMDSDDGFHISEDLLPPAKIKQAGTSALDFGGLLPSPIKLHEDLKEGCGGQLWPAGMQLAKYLLEPTRRDALTGKKIVELGAGGGLVGLALAASLQCDISSSTHVYVTDQAPLVPLIKHNIALNNLPPERVSASILEWSAPIPDHIPVPPDVVLAADCVYFEPSFPLLIETMQRLIGPKTVCYFAQVKRRKADVRFTKELRKHFAAVDCTHDMDVEVEKGCKHGLYLFKITSKNPKGDAA